MIESKYKFMKIALNEAKKALKNDEVPIGAVIVFEGKVINKMPAHKRQVNTIFQRYALFPHLNVYENVAFGLRIKKMREKDIKDKVLQMLELAGSQPLPLIYS